ncbi:ABC transporter permease subunit [Diaminobutyricimonas sp. LJ205]|uniref:ABC transporter permease subunit n=1 Tax=Diaminobutyricimonas sp. LJ205 TaxID=2683590 RepID=UPI0012F4FD9B|nr:ABC transporter permease subunit [Diaminobutyricimonas sp. LJ205]
MPVFMRALADSWRSLIAWSLAVLFALLLYLPLFPSFGATPELTRLLDSLPQELVSTLGYDQIATGAGYVQATFFGLMGFALGSIAGIGWGAAAVAGDEEDGLLELTLAHGVSRVRLVLERALAVAVRLAWLSVLAALIILALNDSAELELEPVNLVAAAAAYLGLILLLAFSALAAGALTGRHSLAVAVGAGVAVLAYALNAIANQSEDLDWLHPYSPYFWAFGPDPLSEGADWASLAALYGVCVALLGIAAVGLAIRDVGR